MASPSMGYGSSTWRHKQVVAAPAAVAAVDRKAHRNNRKQVAADSSDKQQGVVHSEIALDSEAVPDSNSRAM